MEHTTAMPFVRVKERFQLTIPTEVRKALGIKKGDLFEATVGENGTVVYKPKALVDKVEAAIAEGLQDYHEGRVYGPFNNMEEFKASLKKDL